MQTMNIIRQYSFSDGLLPEKTVVRRMQIYLELKGQDASQPHSGSNQTIRPTSLWKAPVPKKAIDKNQKKRSKMPIRKQLKVRLIEKYLSLSSEPEAVATTATAMQTLMMKPTATSTKWPTAKLTPVPLTVYNLPSTKIQEVPSSSIQKPQGAEGPFIPNSNNAPLEQQPTSVEPKAPATALSAIPATRDVTPWPNTVPASKNLFVVKSWLIHSNGSEIPIPAFITMERPDAEKTPHKQGVIPCPMNLSNFAPCNINALCVPP